MMSKFSQPVARLAGLFRRPSAPRPVRRPRSRPTLEGLEDRALPSTLSVLNLDSAPGMTNVPAAGVATAGKPTNSGGVTAARSASLAAPGDMVFQATDVPQPVDFLDVFTTSFIDVPQSVAIAYRREVFERVGLFDESFDACEDVEFNHRIARAGLTCYFTPRVQVRYFPRDSVRMDLLRSTPKTASDLECPHGVQFYDVVENGTRSKRAAWSYEAPQPKMRHVADRFGFWEDVEVK